MFTNLFGILLFLVLFANTDFIIIIRLHCYRMNNNKRAANFNNQEEALLVSLVTEHKDIVECRKTDSTTNLTKLASWKEIADKFNSSTGVSFRDMKTLKNKYENIKKRTKKKFADQKCAVFATGGGPHTIIDINPLDEQLKDLLGVRVDGLLSEMDYDAVSCVPTNDEIITTDTEIIAKEDPSYTGLENSPSTNWSKMTPALLKQKKSSVLKTHKGTKNISKKMELWVQAKANSEQSRDVLFKEESILKKEFITKEHLKKIELMEIEHRAHLNREEEEHKIKIEILNMEKAILIKKCICKINIVNS